MKFARLATAAVIASLAVSAQATEYDFNVLYNGNGNAVLADGSDDPVGQSIFASDSFRWTFSAQSGAEWRVTSTAEFFPLLAFAVSDSGRRNGDWTLTLRNNGDNVFAASESNSDQESVHMGTNTILLSAGLVFDTMELSYTLNSFTPDDANSPNNVIDDLLPIFGAPDMNEFSPGIIYAPVPEPETYALLVAGLAVVAGAVRRRRRG